MIRQCLCFAPPPGHRAAWRSPRSAGRSPRPPGEPGHRLVLFAQERGPPLRRERLEVALPLFGELVDAKKASLRSSITKVRWCVRASICRFCPSMIFSSSLVTAAFSSSMSRRSASSDLRMLARGLWPRWAADTARPRRFRARAISRCSVSDSISDRRAAATRAASASRAAFSTRAWTRSMRSASISGFRDSTTKRPSSATALPLFPRPDLRAFPSGWTWPSTIKSCCPKIRAASSLSRRKASRSAVRAAISFLCLSAAVSRHGLAFWASVTRIFAFAAQGRHPLLAAGRGRAPPRQSGVVLDRHLGGGLPGRDSHSSRITANSRADSAIAPRVLPASLALHRAASASASAFFNFCGFRAGSLPLLPLAVPLVPGGRFRSTRRNSALP